MQEPAEQPGGAEEALKSLGAGLAAVSQDESVPEEAKAAFQAAHDAFQKGLALLEGGGEEAGPNETLPMEAGASKGAVPVSHGRPG